MAYSRFTNSTWYTFWAALSDDQQFSKKDHQIFEICDTQSLFFSYSELNENIDSCIDKVREFYSKDHPGKILANIDDFRNPQYKDTVYKAKNPTEEQLTELKGYMLQFIRDVQEDPDLE